MRRLARHSPARTVFRPSLAPAAAGLLLLTATACAPAAPPQPEPPRPAVSDAGPPPGSAENRGARPQKGAASFYADHFEGKTMANGETFTQSSDSAASKTLPLGTKAQVKNLENGRTAVVTIEDRGPHVPGRVIDLSKKVAERLDMVEDGTAPVEVKPLTNTARR
ncbi:septal ring lytic transglycosylase RlpA family protein [Roseomonas sp. M0104]|uniref:Endolytic peptidoglycan transglycosylase RlpA n=1 Tax=Teichococcus coralli TaxID=2545983 RepID=A0A845BH90_9PROT|nr:septal ring lytic transglycosylase RlpA family protein [Pseudoroseomonas coralli]MXP65450.1 septal ring lytic transglycosylase RlpA family protein [Pseudoroseomonas coralli]